MKQKLLISLYLLALVVVSLRIVLFITAKPPVKDGQRIVFNTRLQQEPSLLGKTQRLLVKTDRAETIFITTDDTQLYTFGQLAVVLGLRKKQQAVVATSSE